MSTKTQDVGQCVRCGFCCRKVTCVMGFRLGSPQGVTCIFLKGDRPSEHSCQLIEDHPELGEDVAIGGGCSSSLFNDDREAAIRHLGIKRRRAFGPQGVRP